MKQFTLETKKGTYEATIVDNYKEPTWSVHYELKNGVIGDFTVQRWADTRLFQFISNFEENLTTK